jgi:hypothetical protein
MTIVGDNLQKMTMNNVGDIDDLSEINDDEEEKYHPNTQNII